MTEIHNAHENVVKAKQLLSSNEIHEAVTFAREAFVAAETVFIDPSLLELLNFPRNKNMPFTFRSTCRLLSEVSEEAGVNEVDEGSSNTKKE